MKTFFKFLESRYQFLAVVCSTRQTGWFIIRHLPFVSLLILLNVAGCRPKQEINPGLTANAGPDQQTLVGQLVTLIGTGTASKGAPLTFQWTIVTKPAKSTVVLATPDTEKTTFVPDEVGTYELMLTVSDGKASQTDRVAITATTAQPLVIDKDITVQTVLIDRIANPNLPDYVVPKSIAVKHQLTIEPGVVIAFERDVRLDVAEKGGILIARGTAEKKIRLVGVNPAKGYWTGLIHFSGSNANILEHVEVLHAGSQPLADNKKAGLVLFKESQISLKNCFFSLHEGYGVFAVEESILREFAANTFNGNSEAGLLLSTDNVAKLDAASIFTSGNGRNVVEINGPYIGTPGQSGEIVWPGFADKTPYRLLNDVAVRAGWKLEPGATVEVERNAVIHVNESGYLSAVGTEASPIRFKGAGATAAYWKGILCLSPSNRNAIENAEILNAGSSSIAGGGLASLAVYGEGATISVRQTRISGSGGYGILVGYGAKLNADAATGNTFTNNAKANIEYSH